MKVIAILRYFQGLLNVGKYLDGDVDDRIDIWLNVRISMADVIFPHTEFMVDINRHFLFGECHKGKTD